MRLLSTIAMTSFVSSLLGFTMTSVAEAYCSATVDGAGGSPCPTGAPLYWSRACISYTIVAPPDAQFDLQELERAASSAFDAWTSTDCEGAAPGVRFRATEILECAEPEYNRAAPNANVIVFVSDWRRRELPQDDLALTVNWFDPETGEIFDSDVMLNDEQERFAFCPASGCGPEMRDIQTVLTHEVGHFLGLAHSDDKSALMHAGYLAGASDGVRRAIANDDVAGICSRFPPKELACSGSDYRPANGLAKASDCPSPASASCAAMLPAARRRAATSYPFAMLVVWVLCQRVRQRLRRD